MFILFRFQEDTCKREVHSVVTHRLGALLELGAKSADVDEVRGEGCVVVGEVPFPRCAALVVVAEDPTEPADVLEGDAVPVEDIIIALSENKHSFLHL